MLKQRRVVCDKQIYIDYTLIPRRKYIMNNGVYIDFIMYYIIFTVYIKILKLYYLSNSYVACTTRIIIYNLFIMK